MRVERVDGLIDIVNVVFLLRFTLTTRCGVDYGVEFGVSVVAHAPFCDQISMSFSQLLRSRSQSSSGTPSAKKVKVEKPKDDLRHVGLPSQAKHILREAKAHIGTPEAPKRSASLKSAMKEIRSGRYGQEPNAAVVRSRASAMLSDPTTEALWSAYEKNEWGGLNDSSSEWAVSTAYRMLGDVFVLAWMKQESTTVTGGGTGSVCPDSLFQAVTGGPRLAVRLWDPKHGFTQGQLSPAGILARAALLAAAAHAPVTEARGEVVSARPLQLGRGGGVGGGGGRQVNPRGCNYCRVIHKLKEHGHFEAQCPRKAAELPKIP